jgi:hypothetical protein
MELSPYLVLEEDASEGTARIERLQADMWLEC